MFKYYPATMMLAFYFLLTQQYIEISAAIFGFLIGWYLSAASARSASSASVNIVHEATLPASTKRNTQEDSPNV